MAIGARRIFHVNSNCTDLDRALAFYEALGLRRALRTVPRRPQDGAAFGLPEVAWDAWMLTGDDGAAGLSLDLLRWTVPEPSGRPPSTVAEPGLNRIVVTTPDVAGAVAAARAAGGTLVGGPVPGHAGGGPLTAVLRDPDGVAVQVLEAERTTISQVIVNCADLDRSSAYYRDVMGLVPRGEARQVDQPGVLHGLAADARVRVASFADPGSPVGVTLVQWVDPPVAPDARADRPAHALGLFRMAWSTDDCAADEAVLRAAGSEPFAPTAPLSVGDDLPLLRVLFWPAPGGECLELIELTDESGVLP